MAFKIVMELTVRPSGTRRVNTADGQLHVVRDSWLTISIEDDKYDWTVGTDRAVLQDNPGWTRQVAEVFCSETRTRSC